MEWRWERWRPSSRDYFWYAQSKETSTRKHCAAELADMRDEDVVEDGKEREKNKTGKKKEKNKRSVRECVVRHVERVTKKSV